MSAVRAVAVLALALALAAGLRASGATFGASSSNPANGFATASDFAKMRLAAGSYAGSGADDRQIAVPFHPDVVMVKATAASEAVLRMTGTPGSKPMGSATSFRTNMIQSLSAAGFEVGTDVTVNAAGTTYYWQAFRAAGGELATGAYTGTGGARSIAGLGFSPEYVVVAGDLAEAAVGRIAGQSAGYRFDPDNGNPQRITSLDADGFGIGTGATVNSSGAAYHWAAWSATPGRVATGTYGGSGVAATGIGGLGLAPEYVIVRAEDRATNRRPLQRSGALGGASSLYFDADTATTAGITALGGDGFEVGTSQAVNASGATYAYVAFRDGGP